MARAVCKVTVHKSHGAANAEYIARPMAAAPYRPVFGTREGRNPASRQVSFEVMQEGEARAFVWSPEQDDDPVWTWNAPLEITGDTYGNRESFQATYFSGTSKTHRFAPTQLGPPQDDQDGRKLSVEEKRERCIAYFSTLADLEERKRGISHFRIILTVGPEVTNRQLKVIVNAFLGETFPLAEAFVAIHRDTLHTHAHLYVHSRQLDNKRVHLGQKFFQLDESWMKICSEHLTDKEIYERHMELKAVTLAWKKRARLARERGEPIPPKDDRWGDHHDTKLSFKPWDDAWCGRLVAQVKVVELKVRYLTNTKAGRKEIRTASLEAKELRLRLESVAEKRRTEGRSETKRRMPTEIITVSEARDLAIYRSAIKDKSKEIQLQPTSFAAPLPPAQAESENRGLVQEVLRFADEAVSGEDSRSAREKAGRELTDGQKDQPKRQDETKKLREGSAEALSDEEAWSLIVNLELARARAIALRTEENDFKAMPHRWLSPTHDISLSQIEQQLVEQLAQRKSIDDFNRLKSRVQIELSEERVRLPQKRAEAETEVKTLTEQLEREKQIRKTAGLTLPSGRFSEEDIRELIVHAESSRDTQLLERIYMIEHAQALETTRSTGDSIAVRRLEEKYVGLKFEAQVNLHQSENSLAHAKKHPTKIMLPAKDEQGKDIATQLDAWSPGKGIKGALRKVTESREHREFRERLEAIKDSYLLYRSQRVERQAAYYETLRAVTSNCRELSRHYGLHTPAAPALTSEKIKEIRDYAVKQPVGIRGSWLRECTQAQELEKERRTLTSKSRQSRDSASQPPDPARAERIRKEIEEARAKEARMVRVPTSRPLNQGRDSNSIDRNRDEQTRTRPRGGGGRSR